jgi:hypothetical protein
VIVSLRGDHPSLNILAILMLHATA